MIKFWILVMSTFTCDKFTKHDIKDVNCIYKWIYFIFLFELIKMCIIISKQVFIDRNWIKDDKRVCKCSQLFFFSCKEQYIYIYILQVCYLIGILSVVKVIIILLSVNVENAWVYCGIFNMGHPVKIKFSIAVCIHPIPPPWVRCNSRSIFKQDSAGLNSVFLLLDW